LASCLNAAFYLRKVFKINPAKIILSSVHHNFGRQLRYLISGGARLEPKVAEDLESWGFAVLEGYGLTETSPIVTFNPMDKPKIGSVGKPIKGVEIKITSPDVIGIGEVAIRGQNVMKGYYKLPEETRKVMRGGWFFSGDLGYLDKEGYLYLTGRSKEVIVLSSGKNIYPEEIEEHYGRSRFIQEICVAGINQENSVALKAVIVPDLAYFQREGLSDIAGKIKWDLENYSRELPGYKRIMGFIITKETLPRTRLGKIKRYELKEKYEKALLGEKPERQEYAPSAEEAKVLHSDTGVKVADYLVKELRLKVSPVLSDHLELDLGIDSLAKVDLALAMEQLFQISLSDEFFAQIATVQDLIQGIEGICNQRLPATTAEKTLPWKAILRQPPSAEMLENIQLWPGLTSRLLTWVVMRLLLVLFKLCFRLEVRGKEYIPPKGPYIFCCNHASFLDAFAVVASVPFKAEVDLYFIGARQIFHHPGVRWAIKSARLIPIDPNEELLSAMEVSGFLLRQGKILCIFPEGQRSIDGKVGEFKKGAGILAAELDVPLVPVAIAGSQAAWGRAVRFPKLHPIKVCFGKPVNYKEFTKSSIDTTIDNYGFITSKIRQAVINLLNEQP
jgi:long-chain acyl-CoA synthetase